MISVLSFPHEVPPATAVSDRGSTQRWLSALLVLTCQHMCGDFLSKMNWVSGDGSSSYLSKGSLSMTIGSQSTQEKRTTGWAVRGGWEHKKHRDRFYYILRLIPSLWQRPPFRPCVSFFQLINKYKEISAHQSRWILIGPKRLRYWPMTDRDACFWVGPHVDKFVTAVPRLWREERHRTTRLHRVICKTKGLRSPGDPQKLIEVCQNVYM